MKRMADLRASIALGLVATAVVVSPARSEESVGPWEAKFNEVYRLADGQNAKFIPRITLSELAALDLHDVVIERAVIEMMKSAENTRSIIVINGLERGNLTRALNGEHVGTIITSD